MNYTTAKVTETYYVRVPEPTFMGFGGWVCFLALVVVACGHLYNWLGRTRYALSWHDVNEVRAIERLRNGIYGQIPWHAPYARVNKLPAMQPIGQQFDLNRVAQLAEQPAPLDAASEHTHTTGGLVPPTFQPIEPVTASAASDPGDSLSDSEVQQIKRMVYNQKASLNKVATTLQATKNSKRYHLIRDQWRKATDLRAKTG